MSKVILITAATSKLGIPMVEYFANKKGWTVYAGARDINNLKIFKRFPSVVPLTLDVTKDQDCEQSLRRIIKQSKKLDYIINNAGITITGKVLEATPQQYQQQLDVNTLGAFRVIKAAEPYLKKQRSASKIVNITSLNGLVPMPYFGIYSSTKFALHALTLVLRSELEKSNIWVTAVAPGAIVTELKDTNKDLTHKPLREKYKILAFMLKMSTQQEVILKIEQVLKHKQPPTRIIVGRDAYISVLLYKILPSFLWDRLVRYLWYS